MTTPSVAVSRTPEARPRDVSPPRPRSRHAAAAERLLLHRNPEREELRRLTEPVDQLHAPIDGDAVATRGRHEKLRLPRYARHPLTGKELCRPACLLERRQRLVAREIEEAAVGEDGRVAAHDQQAHGELVQKLRERLGHGRHIGRQCDLQVIRQICRLTKRRKRRSIRRNGWGEVISDRIASAVSIRSSTGASRSGRGV